MLCRVTPKGATPDGTEEREGAMPEATPATPPAATPTPDPQTPPSSPTPPATPPTEPTTPPTGAELGAGGQAALESERRARRDAEKSAREATAELERLRSASMSDQEKAVAAARREGELTGTRRTLEAKVEALAARKFANPALAARLLDLDQLMPKDGEEVDGERIATAIDELLKTDPYLGTAGGATPPATPPPSTPPPGSVPGGARGNGTGTGTFTRSQLRDPAFYQAHKEEILKAASEGRITDD